LKLLVDIQAAIRAGDLETIRNRANALKGSITSMLAKEAFKAARALDETAHEEDLARVQDACRRLREAIKSLYSTCIARAEGKKSAESRAN